MPVNSSVKRQYVTYLSMDETTMVHPEARTVTASAYTPYFGVSLRKKDAMDQAGVADAVYGLYADEACRMPCMDYTRMKPAVCLWRSSRRPVLMAQRN